jgi:hypothetical protein
MFVPAILFLFWACATTTVEAQSTTTTPSTSCNHLLVFNLQLWVSIGVKLMFSTFSVYCILYCIKMTAKINFQFW